MTSEKSYEKLKAVAVVVSAYSGDPDSKDDKRLVHSSLAEFCVGAEFCHLATAQAIIDQLEADNRSKNGSMKAFGQQIAALQRAVKNRDKMLAKYTHLEKGA